MGFQTTAWRFLRGLFPALWLLATSPLALEAQTAAEGGAAASCSQYMPPKRNVNGSMIGQEECLMHDRGVVEPTRKYRRVDMGISGTLSGWVVKEGARQNYFTSGPDFVYTRYGNPHSPRYHGVLRYEAAKGTSLTLTYPETGWNGKFAMEKTLGLISSCLKMEGKNVM